MKLINWNVNNSAAGRIERQTEWLLGEDPDVLVLTEVNCRHLPNWALVLGDAGYWSSMPGEVTETGKGALIAARLPGRAIGPLFRHAMPQCSVSAEIKGPLGDFEAHGVYARADSGQAWETKYKTAILRAVARGVADRAGPQLIAGDFNSPQAELPGRVVTFAERKNATGEWGLPTRSKYIRLITRKHKAELAIRQPRDDMVDAFVERAADDSPRASWRHYRLDHIILSRELLPTSVRYRPVARSLSDHAAMIAVW